MVVEDLKVSINFYKKQCLPVITWNKKHLSKQLLTIKYTLEKMLFAVATFEVFFLDRVKNLVIYLVCMSLLWISREDKTNLFFYMLTVSLNCNYTCKNNSLYVCKKLPLALGCRQSKYSE